VATAFLNRLQVFKMCSFWAAMTTTVTFGTPASGVTTTQDLLWFAHLLLPWLGSPNDPKPSSHDRPLAAIIPASKKVLTITTCVFVWLFVRVWPGGRCRRDGSARTERFPPTLTKNRLFGVRIGGDKQANKQCEREFSCQTIFLSNNGCISGTRFVGPPPRSPSCAFSRILARK
jgi:hypothetical protein